MTDDHTDDAMTQPDQTEQPDFEGAPQAPQPELEEIPVPEDADNEIDDQQPMER
jgi:hypothetical protein